jgi:glycosyltransferase involved in cell wall biosynthesis
MVNSIYWLSRPNTGIGNGAGYSHHNKKMYEHTSKIFDCDDPNADAFLQIVPADFFTPVPNKVNFLVSMFEMLDIPESYKEPLRTADHVLVPCKYCQDLFKPYTKRLPYIINEGIESKDFPYYQRTEPNYAKGERFRIYWSGAPNPRKGYQYMLRMINNADMYPDMEFYIKTTMDKNNPIELMDKAKELLKRDTLSDKERVELERIANGQNTDKFYEFYTKLNEVKVYGKHKNVFFDTRRVPFEELRELYNKAHVFAFPSQGEGWGLMGTEALATGCPVIAPMHTGILEYFDAQIGYPLDFHIEQVKSSNYDITTGVYVPFYDDLVRQILNVKNNYKEALARGKRGSKRMHEKFRWEQQGIKLAKWLEKLEV